jgi:hypothetical protein
MSNTQDWHAALLWAGVLAGGALLAIALVAARLSANPDRLEIQPAPRAIPGEIKETTRSSFS